MICDCLVVGILNTSLSECLQMDADCTLEKAEQIIRQREAVQKQQSILNHGEQPTEMTLSYVNTDKRSRNQPKTNAASQQRPQQQCSQMCIRCGRGPHSRGACPVKEALATTWACERFSDYILGKTIAIKTDQNPLVPLLSTKHLDSISPRVLCARLRLIRFDYSIVHIPGKQLYTADTLPMPLRTILKKTSDTQQSLRHTLPFSYSCQPVRTAWMCIARPRQKIPLVPNPSPITQMSGQESMQTLGNWNTIGKPVMTSQLVKAYCHTNLV